MLLQTQDFEQAYRRLEQPLFNYVYRWVWDRQAAQDLIHDTFERLWHRRQNLKADGFEALVWTTAINLARNRWRREQVLRWLPLSDPAVKSATNFATDTDSPDQALQDDERDRVLRLAMTQLTRKQREVILLGLYSGLSRSAQARLLRLPEGTLASRKNTASKKLQAIIEKMNT